MIEGVLQSIAIVLGLIALGGIFAAAEIALISLRESQVKQISVKGKRGARVFKLSKNPNRFLAAVQVGITLCGFLSAALGAEQADSDCADLGGLSQLQHPRQTLQQARESS